MKRAFAISRGTWVALALGVALAVTAWLAPVVHPVRSPSEGAEFTALSAELERLRGNDDSVRDELRRQRATLSHNAWSRESLERLQAQSGNPWHWEWPEQDRAILHGTGSSLENWPGLVALVNALGDKPGLVVDSLQLQAEGPVRARRLSTASLELRFLLADSPAAKPAPLPAAPEAIPSSFRRDPSDPSAGISTKQNPQEKSQ